MPKYLYPAIFTKEGDGYTVCFPDIQMCGTQGESLADAYEMAADCLALCLYDMEEDKLPLPAASGIKTIRTDADSFVSYVFADTTAYLK